MMTIEVTKDPASYWQHHVVIDGLIVGEGDKEGCTALADELRADENKARAVYEIFLEDAAPKDWTSTA